MRLLTHSCVPRECCISYLNKKGTIKFSELRDQFNDLNQSLFDTFEHNIDGNTKEDNCDRAFISFIRLQHHLVIAQSKVHISDQSYLDMFTNPPLCKQCDKAKLFGFCSCGKRSCAKDSDDVKSAK